MSYYEGQYQPRERLISILSEVKRSLDEATIACSKAASLTEDESIHEMRTKLIAQSERVGRTIYDVSRNGL